MSLRLIVLIISLLFISSHGSAVSVSDPPADLAVSLPSAEVFQTPGVFDFTSLEIHDDGMLAFDIGLGHVNNPWQLPNGFSLPIIELYFVPTSDQQMNGHSELLKGSGMRLPPDTSWLYAVRISGERLEVWTATNGLLSEISQRFQSRLIVRDNVISFSSQIPIARDAQVYALLGSYDPFSLDASGWRQLSRQESAWLVSSDSINYPVIDILADSDSSQENALRSGVLPAVRTSSDSRLLWVITMFTGLGIALSAYLARFILHYRASQSISDQRSEGDESSANAVEDAEDIDTLMDDDGEELWQEDDQWQPDPMKTHDIPVPRTTTSTRKITDLPASTPAKKDTQAHQGTSKWPEHGRDFDDDWEEW